MNFSDLHLNEDIVRAVSEAGYTAPTPIQEQAIPVVLMGRDVLGCAQTGTGKTASFTLPMIEILSQGRAKARMPRSLILEPTRELATQVAQNFETYGKYHKLSKALLIGGTNMGDQLRVLDRGVDVLIATPGRLLDMFERGKILMADVKVLVIDEADRMLDMGFIPDVERIVSLLSPMRQTLFFSATMAPEIKKLSEKFLMNPKEITTSAPATTADTVKQGVLFLKPSSRNDAQKQKRDALRTLIDSEDVKDALIFCNRKKDVAIVYKSLSKRGYSVGQLHGDMVQSARTEMLAKFKAGEVSLLVCSDVAARGLDIPALSHVFNYDVPMSAEDYVHRIGRTGRAGREGHAFTLATAEDKRSLDQVEALIKKKIERLSLEGTLTVSDEEEKAIAEDPSYRRGGRGGRGGGGKPSSGGRGNSSGGGRGSQAKSNKPRNDKPRNKPQNDKPGETRNKKPAEVKKSSGNSEKSTGLGNHMPAFLQGTPTKGDK